MNQTRFSECSIFDQVLDRSLLSRDEGRHETGSACTWGSTQGCCECWLCLPLQLPSCLCSWAGTMLLLPALSPHPSVEMLLPAMSSRSYPGQISPGVCCCWGSATGCWLPVSARQTSSPDASRAVSAKIRAAGCGSPKADGAVGLRSPLWAGLPAAWRGWQLPLPSVAPSTPMV